MSNLHGRQRRLYDRPSGVEDAKLLSNITFEEMLELSSLGAKVLQIRAVEFAEI